MEKQQIDALFQLSRTAKEAGHYPIANIVFAILLNCLLESEESDLIVEWEVLPDELEQPGDEYHDLLVLRDQEVGYLCIPVPLLRECVREHFRPLATRLPRRQHGLERAAAGMPEAPLREQTVCELAGALFAIEPVDGALAAAAEMLDPGTEIWNELMRELHEQDFWKEWDAHVQRS